MNSKKWDDSKKIFTNAEPFHLSSSRNTDMVNSPSHYVQGRTEAIDVIEDAVVGAPTPAAAVLQAQVLKYLLRLWHKGKSKEDAQKAEWYLKRLIKSLE